MIFLDAPTMIINGFRSDKSSVFHNRIWGVMVYPYLSYSCCVDQSFILLKVKAREIFDLTLDKYQQYSTKVKNLAELTTVLDSVWSAMPQVKIDRAILGFCKR